MSDNYPVDKAIERLETAHAELAARVDEQSANLHWLIGLLSKRLAALESPAAAPDPVCATCGHGQGHHMGRTEFCTVDIARGARCSCRNFVPTAEPEPLDSVLVKVEATPEEWGVVVSALSRVVNNGWQSIRPSTRETAADMIHRIGISAKEVSRDI